MPDMTEPTIDTQALDTIVDIMNENRQWSADELDAIAAVLDAVRSRDGETWKATGPILEWRDGRYLTPSPTPSLATDDELPYYDPAEERDPIDPEPVKEPGVTLNEFLDQATRGM